MAEQKIKRVYEIGITAVVGRIYYLNGRIPLFGFPMIGYSHEVSLYSKPHKKKT